MASSPLTAAPIPARRLSRLWMRPPTELVDAGERGELLVARVRLLFSLLILVVPVESILHRPEQVENWVGLAAAAISSGIALTVLGAVQAGWRPWWLGFVTSLYDVSMISLVLASFFAVGTPYMAANSRVTFEVYFVAIGASALRYDRRVSMVAGTVAALQFGIIAWVSAMRWPPGTLSQAELPYGDFVVPDQIGRVLLLLVAAGLCVTIVDRTEHLRLLSTHDSLTGIYNRAFFDERVEEEVARAQRYDHPLALAIVDIDHFKAVNDQFGHPTGDIVLRRFADLLRDGVRRTDIVARFGGEEFTVLLPETGGRDAVDTLSKLCSLVEGTVVATPETGTSLRLTFSAGVAVWPADGGRAADLIARADARLLEAKAKGRNCVVGPQRAPQEA